MQKLVLAANDDAQKHDPSFKELAEMMKDYLISRTKYMTPDDGLVAELIALREYYLAATAFLEKVDGDMLPELRRLGAAAEAVEAAQAEKQ